jgi:putative SOS response-associated peptidase YedK
MEWGLKPRFKTDTHLTTNNARSEGIEQSKLYAPLINKNRCVLIVDAFYEWKTENKTKRPFLIQFSDEFKERPIPRGGADEVESIDDAAEKKSEFLPQSVCPLLMAGLYDNQEGEFSFTVVTMDSTGEVAKIHERMPLFLTPEDAADWLDERLTYKELHSRLLQTSRDVLSKKLHSDEVSSLVNSIKNQTSDCVLSKKIQDDNQFSKGLGRFFTKSTQSSPPNKKPRI